jgi:hypothetical protein
MKPGYHVENQGKPAGPTDPRWRGQLNEENMLTKKITYSALYIALGIMLPLAFHLLGLGPSFLPMHIPVLLSGFHLGPAAGLMCGLVTPVLSHLVIGMPPLSPPMLPLMMVELPIYGFIGGLLYNAYGINIWISLITSMVLGRLGSGLMAWLLSGLFYLAVPPQAYLLGSLLIGLPGIVLQLLLVPIFVRLLKGRGR